MENYWIGTPQHISYRRLEERIRRLHQSAWRALLFAVFGL